MYVFPNSCVWNPENSWDVMGGWPFFMLLSSVVQQSRVARALAETSRWPLMPKTMWRFIHTLNIVSTCVHVYVCELPHMVRKTQLSYIHAFKLSHLFDVSRFFFSQIIYVFVCSNPLILNIELLCLFQQI